ncbi:MAG: hypothetical protein ABR607_10800 [Pyrinomonadaceae bacterium]
MKKIRRVEVIRYSRHTTVVQAESAAADTAVEQQAGDLMLDVLAEIPMTRDRNKSIPNGAAADPARRRSLFKLGDLLRLRK